MILKIIKIYLLIGLTVSTILVLLMLFLKISKLVPEKEKNKLNQMENWGMILFIILSWPHVLFTFLNKSAREKAKARMERGKSEPKISNFEKRLKIAIEKKQKKDSEVPSPESDFAKRLKAAEKKKMQ